MNARTALTLAPGVRAFLRAPDIVQFGSDATRTGMITTPGAAEVARRINRLKDARTHATVVHMLADPLGGIAEAESLVADLISYRLLVPASKPVVLTLGHGLLAAHTNTLLAEAGVETRSAVGGESPAKFLLRSDSWLPLVVFGEIVRASKVDEALRQRKGPIVPVTHLDARVIVGPVWVPVKGPCTICARLYLLDRDPNWDVVVSNRPANVTPEPISAHAGAAAAAIIARRLAGVPDPPGVSAPAPGPGTTLVVDPFGPEPVRTATLPPHSRCPVCF